MNIPAVILHSRECHRCRGTGVVRYPGGQAERCDCLPTATVSKEEWVSLGRPTDIEAMMQRKKP